MLRKIPQAFEEKVNRFFNREPDRLLLVAYSISLLLYLNIYLTYFTEPADLVLVLLNLLIVIEGSWIGVKYVESWQSRKEDFDETQSYGTKLLLFWVLPPLLLIVKPIMKWRAGD